MGLSRRSAWLPVVVLALAGCFGDLSGVKIRHDSGGSGDEDMAAGGGDDGGTKKDGGTQSSSCALPYLAVLIGGNNGSGSAHGRVERIPLDGRPKCKPLQLANTLPQESDAVGFLPPDTIVVGSLSGVFQITPNDKAAAAVYKPANFNQNGLVDDITVILNQDDLPQLAIAYDSSNLGNASADISWVVLLDGDTETNRWQVGGDQVIRIGFDAAAMQKSVKDRHKLFFTKSLSDGYPAGEFALPWDGSPVESKPPHYQDTLGTPGSTKHMSTLRQEEGSGTRMRTAWVMWPSAQDAPWQVYMATQTELEPKTLLGPYICDLPQCSQDHNKPYLDAVPDPTDPTAVIAICSDPDNTSVSYVQHVVRIRDDGTCESILDGSTLLSQEFPTRLANALVEP